MVWAIGEGKYIYPLLGIEARFLSCPARSIVTTPTMPPPPPPFPEESLPLSQIFLTAVSLFSGLSRLFQI
jgi:hypothetical protein